MIIIRGFDVVEQQKLHYLLLCYYLCLSIAVE